MGTVLLGVLIAAGLVASGAAPYTSFPSSEVDDSLALGKRRFDVRLSDAGVAAGLTAANVAGELRAAFFGAEVQRGQRGDPRGGALTGSAATTPTCPPSRRSPRRPGTAPASSCSPR